MQVLSSLDLKGLPESKESVCDAGGLDSIPGSRRSPGEGYLQKPTPVRLPRELHGQRSLVGSSPRAHKNSDTAERLTQQKQSSSSDIGWTTSLCKVRSSSPENHFLQISVSWVSIAFLVRLLCSWINQKYTFQLFIVKSICHSSSIMNTSWAYRLHFAVNNFMMRVEHFVCQLTWSFSQSNFWTRKFLTRRKKLSIYSTPNSQVHWPPSPVHPT